MCSPSLIQILPCGSTLLPLLNTRKYFLEVTLKTDVVGSDIPLLLSRTAMKRAGVKMDLENDSATIFGKDIALNLTTSGHYCIPIDRTENIAVEEVFSVKLEEMGRQDKVKTLLKLHRQLLHV